MLVLFLNKDNSPDDGLSSAFSVLFCSATPTQTQRTDTLSSHPSTNTMSNVLFTSENSSLTVDRSRGRGNFSIICAQFVALQVLSASLRAVCSCTSNKEQQSHQQSIKPLQTCRRHVYFLNWGKKKTFVYLSNFYSSSCYQSPKQSTTPLLALHVLRTNSASN